MIFVLLDDPVIHEFDSAEAAASDIEGIDVEDGILRGAFDDRGHRMRVEWIDRPTRSSFFGIGCITIGSYRLVPEPHPDVAAFASFLAGEDLAVPRSALDALERLRGSRR